MSAFSYPNDRTPHDSCVDLASFFSAATRNIVIPRQPSVFLPDEWTQTFASGLQVLARSTPDFTRAKVIEVGVGTGIVMAGLLTIDRPPADYIGLDISDDAITAARRLAGEQGWQVLIKKSDLLQDLTAQELAGVQHIVACIPQVPRAIDLNEGDNSAHYYHPLGTYWDTYGLGLNAKLIEQAQSLTPAAHITLNLSGRPGLPRLKALFEQHGYTPAVLHERMVGQHAGTSLESLAALENAGHEAFEFFADEQGQQPLSAREAEFRRLEQQAVFHKVYVVHAPAQTLR